MKIAPKKTLIYLVLILLVMMGIYQLLFFLKVPDALARKKGALKFPDKYEEYTSIKCSFFDLYFPKYAFVDRQVSSGGNEEFEIMFYKVKTLIPSFSDEDFNYIGGTDISNTTFHELVIMVKQDCSQFQYGYDNPDPNGPRWSYTSTSEDDVVEYQEQTETEVRAYQIIADFGRLPEDQQNMIIENYGNINELTLEEIVKWEAQITRDIKEEKFILE